MYTRIRTNAYICLGEEISITFHHTSLQVLNTKRAAPGKDSNHMAAKKRTGALLFPSLICPLLVFLFIADKHILQSITREVPLNLRVCNAS